MLCLLRVWDEVLRDTLLCVQQKREEYVQAKRMREEAELEEKKRIQREKV